MRRITKKTARRPKYAYVILTRKSAISRSAPASESVRLTTVRQWLRSIGRRDASAVVRLESRLYPLEARFSGVQVITHRPSSNWRTREITADACYRADSVFSATAAGMPDLHRRHYRPLDCLFTRLLFFRPVQSLDSCYWQCLIFASESDNIFSLRFTRTWLRNVLVFAIANPSVVCLSVTFVRPDCWTPFFTHVHF